MVDKALNSVYSSIAELKQRIHCQSAAYGERSYQGQL